MRLNFIRLMPGDKVTVEMSPYDLSKAGSRSGIDYEGKTISKTVVRALQSSAAKRCGARDLHQPSAQATARVGVYLWRV